MKIKARSNHPLAKKVRKGFRGYPIATVALYGFDDQLANKLVIGIVKNEGAEPELRKWFSDEFDIRSLPDVDGEIMSFIREQGVLSCNGQSHHRLPS